MIVRRNIIFTKDEKLSSSGASYSTKLDKQGTHRTCSLVFDRADSGRKVSFNGRDLEAKALHEGVEYLLETLLLSEEGLLSVSYESTETPPENAFLRFRINQEDSAAFESDMLESHGDFLILKSDISIRYDSISETAFIKPLLHVESPAKAVLIGAFLIDSFELLPSFRVILAPGLNKIELPEVKIVRPRFSTTDGQAFEYKAEFRISHDAQNYISVGRLFDFSEFSSHI